MKSDIRTPIPPEGDSWRDNEIARRWRIREDAKRPLGVNLSKALDLSEFQMKLAASLRPK